MGPVLPSTRVAPDRVLLNLDIIWKAGSSRPIAKAKNGCPGGEAMKALPMAPRAAMPPRRVWLAMAAPKTGLYRSE